MKKTVAVLLAALVLLLCSCEDKNRKAILEYDRYASYEPYYSNSYVHYAFDDKSIDFYYTESITNGAVIRIYVYDENVEHVWDNNIWDDSTVVGIDIPHTLTKAEVREVYFMGDEIEYELNLGDNIWLLQMFYVEENINRMVIYDVWTSFLIPGCEYLIYTKLCTLSNGDAFLGSKIFDTKQPGIVPLNITRQEYSQILENNGFIHIEHDDICEKAIEKYINGNK